jgi:deoxyribodipyrimidine photo-lyase
MPSPHVVWFKRDLRIADHAPLYRAARRGPVLCLYVYEPKWFDADDFAPGHLRFVNQCLVELDEDLRQKGSRLVTRVGSVTDILAELKEQTNFEKLWSHEETGVRWTYDRDVAVGEWCAENNVEWEEVPQNGVVRRLKSRDGWSKRWKERMSQPVSPAPERIEDVGLDAPAGVRTLEELGVDAPKMTETLPGGRARGLKVLNSFLDFRGANYRADMSSPVEGTLGCSRLSPYLAWGAVSIREVHQKVEERQQELRGLKEEGWLEDKRWLGSMRSFQGRLRWHCHFMQKLEDEPDIEFENMNRGFDGMRESEFRDDYFEAWRKGESGYPMVDACMRALAKTGWVNFRMRAMLMSFASYHLWLHWRPTSLVLARRFLDYEPGIHFSQSQMQSGVTGINAIRIYSPPKQVKDQDPTGVYIRKWVPELRDVPNKYLSKPQEMPEKVQKEAGCCIGTDYPEPLVEHGKAYMSAKDRVWTWKKSDAVQKLKDEVYQKHGSRRGSRS